VGEDRRGGPSSPLAQAASSRALAAAGVSLSATAVAPMFDPLAEDGWGVHLLRFLWSEYKTLPTRRALCN
jgi:hypothetical protein